MKLALLHLTFAVTSSAAKRLDEGLFPSNNKLFQDIIRKQTKSQLHRKLDDGVCAGFDALFDGTCALDEYCAAQEALTGKIHMCRGFVTDMWSVEVGSEEFCLYESDKTLGPFDEVKFNADTDICLMDTLTLFYSANLLVDEFYVQEVTRPAEFRFSVRDSMVPCDGANYTAVHTFGDTDFCYSDACPLYRINGEVCQDACVQCASELWTFQCTSVDPRIGPMCEMQSGNDLVRNLIPFFTEASTQMPGLTNMPMALPTGMPVMAEPTTMPVQTTVTNSTAPPTVAPVETTNPALSPTGAPATGSTVMFTSAPIDESNAPVAAPTLAPVEENASDGQRHHQSAITVSSALLLLLFVFGI